jgi:hypothetical protein
MGIALGAALIAATAFPALAQSAAATDPSLAQIKRLLGLVEERSFTLGDLEAVPRAPEDLEPPGSDPQGWAARLASGGNLRHAEVFPGVDLIYTGSAELLEAVLIVQPGADPAAIQLEFAGLALLELGEGNVSLVHTETLDIILLRPRIFQEIGAEQRGVEGAYAAVDEQRLTVALQSYQSDRPLVVYLQMMLPGTALRRLADTDADGRIALAELEAYLALLAERGVPDLTATMTDSPSSASPGDTVTYTVQITNNGGGAATGVSSTTPRTPTRRSCRGRLRPRRWRRGTATRRGKGCS